jgi:hypothetical protein
MAGHLLPPVKPPPVIAPSLAFFAPSDASFAREVFQSHGMQLESVGVRWQQAIRDPARPKRPQRRRRRLGPPTCCGTGFLPAGGLGIFGRKL